MHEWSAPALVSRFGDQRPAGSAWPTAHRPAQNCSASAI